MNEDDDIMAKTDLVEACVQRKGPISARDVWESVDELVDYTQACAILNSLRKQGRVELVGKDAYDRNLYKTPGATAPAATEPEPPVDTRRKRGRKEADEAQVTHYKEPVHQVAPPPEPPAPLEVGQRDDSSMDSWLSVNDRGQLQIGAMWLSVEDTRALLRFLSRAETGGLISRWESRRELE